MTRVRVLGFRVASPGDYREEWGGDEESFIDSFAGAEGLVESWDFDRTHPITVYFPGKNFKRCRFAPEELSPA